VRVPTFQGREFFVLCSPSAKTVRKGHLSRLARTFRALPSSARSFNEIQNWLARYNP